MLPCGEVGKGAVPFLLRENWDSSHVGRRGTVPFLLRKNWDSSHVGRRGTVPFLLRKNWDSPQRGFTLLEVLLTLALLVIIAALAWPVLQRPLANQRLRKAADRVRARWVAARVDAMDSGQTYVFQYAIAGDSFSVRTYVTELAAVSVFGEESDLGVESAADPADRRDEERLPEDVVFVAGETAADSRAATVSTETDSLAPDEGAWSEPILFYPDGTTSTAGLMLQNEYGRRIELSLRGLTGVVTVGEVYSAEEQPP